MKKGIKIILIILAIAGACVYVHFRTNTNSPKQYSGIMKVVATNDKDEIIAFVDYRGHEWVVETEPEDTFVGDYFTAIFNDNGTPDYIEDDIIEEYHYINFN